MNLSKLNLSTEAKKVIKQGYGFRSDSISDLDYQSRISAMTALKREILDDDRLELLQRILAEKKNSILFYFNPFFLSQ